MPVELTQDTSQRIVSVATRLFAQKGYEGVSTKEICDLAEVNIAAIHYHFESKEQLYSRILEQFASARLETAQRTLVPPKTLDELKVRLEIFLTETLEFLLERPDLARIIQREMETAQPRGEEVFRKTMFRHFETQVEFLAQAKKHKLIASDIDPFLATTAFFGQMVHQIRMCNATKKLSGHSILENEFRSRWIKHTLRLFFGGILNEK